MPSRRAKRNRVTIHHDDDTSERDGCHDITVGHSATGYIYHSTTLVSKPEEGTLTGPWADDFFEKNSETLIDDSVPIEPHGFDTPDSQLDFDKDHSKVLTGR